MFLIGVGMQSSFVDYVINELKEIKVFEIDFTQYRLASRFYKQIISGWFSNDRINFNQSLE